MADCTQLSKSITDLAMKLASDPAIKNIDELIDAIRQRLPELSRDDIISAIVEVSESQQKQLTELAKKLQQIRQDAKSDKAIQKRIDELQKHLDEGTLPELQAKAETKAAPSIVELREIRDALRKDIGKSDPAKLKRVEKSIADMIKGIESGDIFQPKIRETVKMSPELERAIYERDRLRRDIRAEIRNREPKSITYWLAEPFNITRSMIASVDFSAVLRQGGFVALGHPIQGIKTTFPMFKATFSAKNAAEINNEILSRPNAPLYARSKLYIAPVDGSSLLSQQEEYYMSALADKIPWVRASERAYVTFLNVLRADTFDSMVATLSKNGEPTIEEINAIANYINVATGRGELGKITPAAQQLNTVFFAPRYVTSRFQILAGQPFYHGSSRTRALIAQEYARYFVGLGIVYMLASLAGGDIEKDPRSSDFGKIRFGDTRIDALSGLSQVTVLVSRVGTGQFKSTTTGEITPLRGDVPFGRPDTFDILANFGRSKFSPLIGIPVDILTGSNIVGEEVTPGKVLVNAVTPLSLRDVYDAIKDLGLPGGTAAGLLSIFGFGLMSYSVNKETTEEMEIRDEWETPLALKATINDFYKNMTIPEAKDLPKPDWYLKDDWAELSGTKKKSLYKEHEIEGLYADYPGFEEADRQLGAYGQNVDEVTSQLFPDADDDFIQSMMDVHKEFYALPEEGYSRDRLLLEHKDDYYQVWLELGGGHTPVDFERIPNEQYDVLLAKENRTPFEEKQMEAYYKQIPDAQVDNYATWYTNYSEKPDGQEGTWYEDDWWLMEHPEFQQAMIDSGVWSTERDFSKVPTRQVWNLYQQYDALRDREGNADTEKRLAFRKAHPDLQAWGEIKFGWKPLK